jgi:hypothetical protein
MRFLLCAPFPLEQGPRFNIDASTVLLETLSRSWFRLSHSERDLCLGNVRDGRFARFMRYARSVLIQSDL